MGVLSWIWDHAKVPVIVILAAAAAIALGVPLVAAAIAAGLVIVTLGVLGVLGTWGYIGWLSARNGSGEPLSDVTKRIMRDVFDEDVVNGARLIQHAMGVAPETGATTVGVTIYWKGAYVECGAKADTQLLCHELVHVRQYLDTNDVAFTLWYGFQAAMSLSHDAISYEQEATEFADTNEATLESARSRECYPAGSGTAAADLEWLVLVS